PFLMRPSWRGNMGYPPLWLVATLPKCCPTVTASRSTGARARCKGLLEGNFIDNGGWSMTISWKPEGYSSVSPYLVVSDAQYLINFLKESFDASELRRYDRPDGSIMHAEVRIGDTVVMLGDAGEHWPALHSN